MPFLARNMGLVASGIMATMGLTIGMNYPYREGIEPVQMTVSASTGGGVLGTEAATIALESNFGQAMLALCFMGGFGMMAFEYWTYGNRVVRVEPFYWKLRVGLYLGLALPGYLTAFLDGLMPPLLPAIMFTITGLTNLAACYGTLPSEKEWRWQLFPDKKKAEEAGGKVEGCLDRFAENFQFRQLWEQGLLPRMIFLAWYTALNIAVGLHAYYRHGHSEKGKALRGEAFLACPIRSGQYGEPGLAPVDPCWGLPPCADSFYESFRCLNGDPPVAIAEADPPLLKTWWVGFGWLGFPTAKAMGQLLNLNCAILLMPVTHSMITKAHDMTSIFGPPWLRWLAFVFPFDKAVVFHKACAKYFILPCVAVHGVLHYFNYGRAPYYTALLGKGAYPATPLEAAWGVGYGAFGLTGELIVLAMFFIYNGAHEKVKRAHYETFWNTHHFFILFFVCLYLHGSVFWQWGLFTTLPYAFDRLVIRILYRGTQPFALARVFFWGKPGKPDVITLQFENSTSDKGKKPAVYMEGHYGYLQCPHVEGERFGKGGWTILPQWHPFTISSAPDEPVLEFNIRVTPSPHAWTHKMCKYLMLFDPEQTGAVEFRSRNTNTGGTTLGKVLGPDGKPFFHVDVPHGAPSQHVFCYDTAMIVGAGIGVTPCSSIMRGVVNYRWKKGYSPNTIYFFFVARMSDLVYFRWLMVMLPELKAKELVHNEYYAGDKQRADEIRTRIEQLARAMKGDGDKKAPEPPGVLPAGWVESRTPTGQLYYFNEGTGETSWVSPAMAAAPLPESAEAQKAELERLQAALREAGANQRKLEVTLYLTGAKKDDLKIDPATVKRGSPQELILKLQEAKDPRTGEPYIHLKPGRPDWPGEFKAVAATHGREDVGVMFCGAPMIAAALKENCEKLSTSDGTIFRLHKENF